MSKEAATLRRKQVDPRVDLECPARLVSIDPELDRHTGGSFFRVCDEACVNLSRGGALIVTPDPIERGRRVLLELDIPGSPTFQAVGRVAWSKVLSVESGEVCESGTGIEFTAATRENLITLDAYLERSGRRKQPSRKRAPVSQPRPSS